VEPAHVAQVVDGDTVVLSSGEQLRYIGINTPERDRPFYVEATIFNRQLVEGKDVLLEFDTVPRDQYGRLLAYVWVGGRMVNLELALAGYASAYTLPPNIRYAQYFLDAERYAREAGRGLWTPSPSPVRISGLEYNPPGPDEQNLNGEWVELTNQGNEAVNLRGYTLKDEGNKVYTFGDVILQAGEKVRLHTGAGQDGPGTLYWGSRAPIWNNYGDAAFLYDPQGRLVDSYRY